MSVLATDDFNRANENPLGNGVWTTSNGQVAWQIQTSTATPTDVAVTNDGSYYSGIAWPNDQYSQAKLTVSSSAGGDQGVGLLARQKSTSNTFYALVTDHAAASNVNLIKFVGGAGAILNTTTHPWTDGDTWRLEVQGTTLRAIRNTSTITTTTDASIANGSPGIFLSTAVTSASLDDWEGGDFATGAGSIAPISFMTIMGVG